MVLACSSLCVKLKLEGKAFSTRCAMSIAEPEVSTLAATARTNRVVLPAHGVGCGLREVLRFVKSVETIPWFYQ